MKTDSNNIEAKALFVKEKLCRNISRYGSLSIPFEQVDEKLLNQLTRNNER